MKPILAFVLAAAVASPAAAAGPMAGGGSGTLKPEPGPWSSGRSTTPTYRATTPPASTAPRRYGVPTPPPSTSSTSPNGASRFDPYRGSSVYSDRGGVNAYPKPDKPRGYIDPNGPRRF